MLALTLNCNKSCFVGPTLPRFTKLKSRVAIIVDVMSLCALCFVLNSLFLGKNEREALELLQNTFYSHVFPPTDFDPDVYFLSRQDAMSVLPGQQDNRRKTNCGGWVTRLPSIVLRGLRLKCTPYHLYYV